jgi:hypothetical protein
VISVEHSTAAARSGGTMNLIHCVVEYRFTGPLGDSVEVTVAAESFDAGDKATAKAMSVALRTALLQTLLLPTDDPDPDATTYERATPRETSAESGLVSGLARASMTPIQWITQQGEEVLPDWSKAERNAAYKAAREALAIDRISSMEDARLILSHMEANYETKGDDADGY